MSTKPSGRRIAFPPGLKAGIPCEEQGMVASVGQEGGAASGASSQIPLRRLERSDGVGDGAASVVSEAARCPAIAGSRESPGR